jgi:hypothetical protein
LVEPVGPRAMFSAPVANLVDVSSQINVEGVSLGGIEIIDTAPVHSTGKPGARLSAVPAGSLGALVTE